MLSAANVKSMASTHCLLYVQDDAKGSQQRRRYDAAKQQAEQERIALQRQAWLKHSLARRRIEAARQHQQLHLKTRAKGFDAKMDAIRYPTQ